MKRWLKKILVGKGTQHYTDKVAQEEWLEKTANEICQLFPKSVENPDGYEPNKKYNSLEQPSDKIVFPTITTGGSSPSEVEAVYTLVCDKCGEIFYSPDGFPSPQLCPKCQKPDESRLLTPEELFEVDYGYLPSPKDIEDGLENVLSPALARVAKAQLTKDKAQEQARVERIISGKPPVLSGTEIGDNIDLEIEATYPCSDGGVIHTVSVERLLKTQLAKDLKHEQARVEGLVKFLEDKWAFDQAYGRPVYSCNLEEWQTLREKEGIK